MFEELEYAKSLQQQGKFEDALLIYRKLLDTYSDNYEIYERMAACLLFLKRYVEAREFCRRVISEGIAHQPVLNLILAIVYQKLGEIENAQKEVDKVLKLSDDSEPVLVWYGIFLRETREYEKAQIVFKKVLSLYPDSIAAHRNMVMFSRGLSFGALFYHLYKILLLEKSPGHKFAAGARLFLVAGLTIVMFAIGALAFLSGFLLGFSSFLFVWILITGIVVWKGWRRKGKVIMFIFNAILLFSAIFAIFLRFSGH